MEILHKSATEWKYATRRCRILLLRPARTRNWTDADIDKTMNLDPAKLVYYQSIRHVGDPRLSARNLKLREFVVKHVGRVLDGDWDLKTSIFSDYHMYRLLHEHFVDGVAWEDTKTYPLLLEHLRDRGRAWHNCTSVEAMRLKSRYVDRLYEAIKRSGYQGRPCGARKLGFVDEVTVSIGRNGEFLYSNIGGHHRLIIAKLLGIETIPARVLLRHKAWQSVRDEFNESTNYEQLSARTRQYLQHPDLQDVISDALLPQTEYDASNRVRQAMLNATSQSTGTLGMEK